MQKIVQTKLKNLITTKCDSIDKDYPYNSILYLDTGSIILNNILSLEELNIDNLPSRAKKIAKNEDIIFSLVRPEQKHYGYLESIPKNLILSTGFCIIRNQSKILKTKFLYYFLTTPFIVDYLNQIAQT